ncbi:MAG: glucohydrolase [Clostridiales bacterium]|nr:glucohydrolase [Clostridiales bacterium]
MIGYQIYIRTFRDSNNDGVGDIAGIIEKIPYISSLGVDYIWITPFYQSPMDDNGYDISDYCKVDQIFGDNDDLKMLIKVSHEYNIKVVVDLVMNHTSDEHEWFRKSIKRIEPYTDYYIWRDGNVVDGVMCPPNDWQSFFHGPAWKFCEERGQYYLHLFSEKMPDLNFENSKVLNEMGRVIQYYCDLGVDGFRLDAISHLGKDNFGNDYLIPQYKHFSNMPKTHKYLQYFHRIFHANKVVTMGELGGDPTEEDIVQYLNNELNAVFTFEQLGVFDEHNKINKDKLRDVLRNKNSIDGKAMLFWMNHDYPRLLSRISGETDPVNAQICLATLMYMLKGNVMIYNGEEIGMENYHWKSIDEFQDVEARNLLKKSTDVDQTFNHLKMYSRDNARSTMQWDNSIYGGFGGYAPVAKVGDYKNCNVKIQEKDANSMLSQYKKIIKLRKKMDGVISQGKYTFYTEKDIVGYKIDCNNKKIWIVANLSNEAYPVKKTDVEYSNMPLSDALKPYQVIVATSNPIN